MNAVAYVNKPAQVNVNLAREVGGQCFDGERGRTGEQHPLIGGYGGAFVHKVDRNVGFDGGGEVYGEEVYMKDVAANNIALNLAGKHGGSIAV